MTVQASSSPAPPPNRTTLLLSTHALSTSPHFLPLIDLCNATFTHSHAYRHPGKQYLPPEGGRFSAPSDMLDELGPSGFSFIQFAAGEGSQIIGTASAKPFTESKAGAPTDGHHRLLFKRPPPTEDSQAGKMAGELDNERAERWEVLIMAVDPQLQGQGIAGALMEMVVVEIRRRVAEGGKEGKIVLMLSAMQELNEGYYLKRGWSTTGKRRFERGTMGSRDGFSVVEMVKIIDL